MNKKGFTLIELLAVIVILAVIALIATPMVLDTIDDAKKGAASSSAYSYMSGVETAMASYMITSSGKSYPAGSYDITKIETDLNVSIKGSKPTKGNLCIGTDGTVTGASIMIDGYVVNYDGKEATTTDLKEVEIITCSQEGAGSGGATPEVSKVELKDASAEIKAANNYFGEVSSATCNIGNAVIPDLGYSNGWEIGDIIYLTQDIPNACMGSGGSSVEYTLAKGYYKVIQLYNIGHPTPYTILSINSSSTGYIEYLGESRQVNAQ